MAEKVEKSEKKQKPKREKKGGGLGGVFKGIWSELKKVTWPSFPSVLKNTGIVLAMVAIFLVILLGFDLLLSTFITSPLTSGTIGTIGSISATESSLTSAFKAVF